MRILVVADIHANTAALAAVRGPFDVCLCLGDLVEYGPDPAGAVAWARAHATHTVRGNHDHGTAQNVPACGASGFKYLTRATRGPTVAALAGADRRYLADLPTTVMLTLAGKRFLLCHASPRDPLDEYVPQTPEAWADRLAGLAVDYLCVGHTHQQFALQVGRTTVLNPGSVGLPRDGDPRARYALIDAAGVHLRQVPYDVDRVVAEVAAAPLEDRAKELLADVYRHGRYVPAANGHPAAARV